MWLPGIDTGNRVRTLDSPGNGKFEWPWSGMSMHKKSERGQHNHPNHPEDALYNMPAVGASSILIDSRRNTIERSLYYISHGWPRHCRRQMEIRTRATK